jgi:hypothetical protein
MNGEGDCYEAAAKLLYAHRSCPGIVLVHGTVTGQGPIAGIRYGHAWIEAGDVVLDPSNGRFVCARKSAYYAAGEIREPVSRYDFEAAAWQMLETRHHGPWETCPILTPPAGAKRSHTADKRGFSEDSTPSLQPIPSTARKMVKKSDGLSPDDCERPRTMNEPNYQAGDRVRIAPKWDGDDTLYVIVEWNIDRGVITPLYWPHGVLRPQELATADMIEPAHFPRPVLRKARSHESRQRKEKGNQ